MSNNLQFVALSGCKCCDAATCITLDLSILVIEEDDKGRQGPTANYCHLVLSYKMDKEQTSSEARRKRGSREEEREGAGRERERGREGGRGKEGWEQERNGSLN